MTFGLETFSVPIDQNDGEVGEEDEEVRDDVADDHEGPGVDHVSLAGGQEVHCAGVEISLIHISTMSQYYLFYLLCLIFIGQFVSTHM